MCRKPLCVRHMRHSSHLEKSGVARQPCTRSYLFDIGTCGKPVNLAYPFCRWLAAVRRGRRRGHESSTHVGARPRDGRVERVQQAAVRIGTRTSVVGASRSLRQSAATADAARARATAVAVFELRTNRSDSAPAWTFCNLPPIPATPSMAGRRRRRPPHVPDRRTSTRDKDPGAHSDTQAAGRGADREPVGLHLAGGDVARFHG